VHRCIPESQQQQILVADAAIINQQWVASSEMIVALDETTGIIPAWF